jgi:hypothetical protein
MAPHDEIKDPGSGNCGIESALKVPRGTRDRYFVFMYPGKHHIKLYAE